MRNEISPDYTPAQLAAVTELWAEAAEMFADTNVELNLSVRPSGVLHLVGSEPCWLTNLPSYLLGCVTPTGVVHNYLQNPYEL